VNCNTGAGRLVHEELFIGSIHFVEVGHVSEVYSQLDDLRNARPTGLQNGRNVPAADRSLLADTAFDQLPRWINGDLARHEDLPVGLYSLALLYSKKKPPMSLVGRDQREVTNSQ